MTFTLICRSLITYSVVLFLIRIMGKRQIGQMQPFELVITLILADIATFPMSESTIPIIQGIVPLFTLTLVHYLICLLSRKSIKFRKLFNGKPIILINEDGVDFESLKKANMNFSDLQESLRSDGYFNLEEILYAILQTNGSIAVLNRAQYLPVTNKDLEIKSQPATLPIVVYSEDKFFTENCKIAKTDDSFYKNQLKKYKLDLYNIQLITIDQSGKMYVKPRNDKFLIIDSGHTGGNW